MPNGDGNCPQLGLWKDAVGLLTDDDCWQF